MTPAIKIRDLRTELNARFPERRTVIDGCIAAVLASEHVLFIGPPGTAKSLLARSIAQAFSGTYFERLLTKFSTPDELFGPVSLRALEQDRFERQIAGKLPEAEFAFVDEIFKANSAILNSMLTLMNERIFHNDRTPLAAPLVTMFGASNELPEGRELEAMFDRFMMRFDVQYLVQLSNLRAVLLADDPIAKAHMTIDELRIAQQECAAVTVSTETLEGLIAIRESCQSDGIIASDRRWKKCLKLVRASAYMMGETVTTPEDLSILVDSLWREPKERFKVAGIVGKYSDPLGQQATEVLDAARELAASVITLKNGEAAAYVTAVVRAREEFSAMQYRLGELTKGAGARSMSIINAAIGEICGLDAEATRAVTESLSLPQGGKRMAAVAASRV